MLDLHFNICESGAGPYVMAASRQNHIYAAYFFQVLIFFRDIHAFFNKRMQNAFFSHSKGISEKEEGTGANLIQRVLLTRPLQHKDNDPVQLETSRHV